MEEVDLIPEHWIYTDTVDPRMERSDSPTNITHAPPTSLLLTGVSPNITAFDEKLKILPRSATEPIPAHGNLHESTLGKKFRKINIQDVVQFLKGEALVNLRGPCPQCKSFNDFQIRYDNVSDGLSINCRNEQCNEPIFDTGSDQSRPSTLSHFIIHDPINNVGQQNICSNEFTVTARFVQGNENDISPAPAIVTGSTTPNNNVAETTSGSKSSSRIRLENVNQNPQKPKLRARERVLSLLRRLHPKRWKLSVKHRFRQRSHLSNNLEANLNRHSVEESTNTDLAQGPAIHPFYPEAAEGSSRQSDAPDTGSSDIGPEDGPETASQPATDLVEAVDVDRNTAPPQQNYAGPSVTICRCTPSCICRRDWSDNESISTSLRVASRSTSDGFWSSIRHNSGDASNQAQDQESLLSRNTPSPNSILFRHMGGFASILNNSPRDSVYSNSSNLPRASTTGPAFWAQRQGTQSSPLSSQIF